MVDSGKITLKIRADHVPLEGVHAISVSIAQKLKDRNLGAVIAVDHVDYEPFTAESPYFGQRWIQIEMCLAQMVQLSTLVDLLALAGAPGSSHLTYTISMQLAGCNLSEVARSGG